MSLRSVLGMVLIICVGLFAFGCSQNETPTAAMDTPSNENVPDERAGFIYDVNYSVNGLTCEATVTWKTQLNCVNNKLIYGRDAQHLSEVAYAANGGTEHSVTFSVYDYYSTYSFQIGAKYDTGFPWVWSKVFTATRGICISE